MAVPKLRFKADDGNEFPDWTQKSLGDIFTERVERSSGNEELLAVTIASGVIKQSELTRRNVASSDSSNYKVVHKKDIAYNTMRMWQGAEGVSNYDGIISPAYTVVYCNNENLSEFFGIMFKRLPMLHQFERYSQGLTSDTWNLKYKSFSKIQVFVPSFDEQGKIVVFFSLLDETIKKCQTEVDAWERYKRGVMQQLFSQKVRFKADDGNEYPEWETKTLKDCCDCLDNMRKPVTKSDRKPGSFPYYGSTDIQDYVDDYIFNEPLVLLAEDAGPFNDFATKPIAQYAEGKYWVNNHAHVLRPHGNRKYMFYALVHKDIRMYINSPDRGKLNQKSMDKIEVPYPCLEEQQKIADCLSAFDEVIDKAKQKLEAYKQLKKGLLQQMFV